ncbi:unnamed protein product [Lupinus luteus]|uniref:Glycosyltransferase n=1 Tax=Lupinus luteus TaxID=3873 RepID=A0AAV1W0E2_LUPLU
MSETQQLNVIFLPFPLPGHMNPMVDTARLFAKHGANVTIITTQAYALSVQKVIESGFSYGYPIKTHVVQFPSTQIGMADGAENTKVGTSGDLMDQVILGAILLKDQVEIVLHDLKPDCIVTDQFYPWTVDTAAKLGIPRLYFHVTSYFSSCASHCIQKYKPQEKVGSDSEKFLIPGLPHNTEITTLQLEEWVRTSDEATTEIFNAQHESESRSYGILCNSFHEIELDYEELYKSTLGLKSWSLGPVSTWVKKYDEEKENNEKKEGFEEHPELLNWLNSKENESVLYVSFGSLTRHPRAQLLEIAHGLENCGHNFIWVVRNMDGVEDEDTLPKGFEQRVKQSNKGFILWNWAPQLLIVNHPAIGGIVTHCGWNAIHEGLHVGLPMITWPIFAEQFYNEKLLVDVLKVAVAVGAKENRYWMNPNEDASVRREEIVSSVKLLMGNEEKSIEMRKRARKLSDAGKRAIEEGGSSYNNLMQLIDELKSFKISRSLHNTN